MWDLGITVKKWLRLGTPVAHTWNPSYSGGRDQEDHSSKLAQANISKTHHTHKKGLVECLKV
jgi:hypothetical protein